MHYDVFNGDADGILSLLQLRLHDSRSSTLITGVKRDILLLERIRCTTGDSVTVLDISMAKNSQALRQILQSGAHVFYADHHLCGDIPDHPCLDAHIDLDANMCTALIIDRYLNGKYRHWAIAATFGDNLISVVEQLAEQSGLTATQTSQLRKLGTYINYNGYGRRLEELHYHPAELLRCLLRYDSPWALFDDQHSPYYRLEAAYHQDLDFAMEQRADYESRYLRVFRLPDTAASHRVSGVFSNELANREPEKAHAVLTLNDKGSYTVSLRAPLNNKQGAGKLCSQFPTGGGREAAAGINELPLKELDRFIQEAEHFYSI